MLNFIQVWNKRLTSVRVAYVSGCLSEELSKTVSREKVAKKGVVYGV